MAPMLSARAMVTSFALLGCLGGAGAVVEESRPLARSRADGQSRLAMRLTADLRACNFGEALEYVCGSAGLEVRVFWTGVDAGPGIDREAMVSMRFKGATVEESLERILATLEQEDGDDPTWQLAPDGSLQVGPRSRLNRFRRVEVYAIADLVAEAPDFDDAPTIDLAAALGGNDAIFRSEEGAGRSAPAETAETPAERLASLVMKLVEPAQWHQNGGDGAQIHLLGDSLVIDAPEYIHRQIDRGSRP
jgi:hypothetical protein